MFHAGFFYFIAAAVNRPIKQIFIFDTKGRILLSIILKNQLDKKYAKQ